MTVTADKNRIAIMRLFSVLCIIALIFSLILPSSSLVSHASQPDTVRLSVPDFTESERWSVPEGIMCATRAVNGKKAIYFGFTGADGDVVLKFSPDKLDVSLMTEMHLALAAGSTDKLTLKAGIRTPDGTLSFSKKYTDNYSSVTDIYIPINGLGEDYEIILTVIGENKPSFLVVTDVGFDNGQYGMYLEKFGASDLLIETGNATPYTDGIGITPAGSSDAAVSPVFIEDTSEDISYLVWMTVDGCIGGNISVIAEDEDGNTVSTSSAQTLAEGAHTYPFIVYGAFSSVSFVFNGISLYNGRNSFQLPGGGIMAAGDLPSDKVGSITSCKYKDGKITVSGSLLSSAAAKYVSYDLLLYIIPVWENEDDALLKAPAATMDFSTKFEISAIPEEYYSCCRYKVMLSDGNEMIPVGNTVFASSGDSVKDPPVSVCTVDCADTSGAFVANMSSVIIDVPLDDMIKTDDIYSTQLYSFGGSYYYYGTDALLETDRKAEFYSAAGIRVYLKLCTSDGVLFDISDKASVNKAVAAALFLSERYEGVAGFILGDRMNPSSTVPDTEYIKDCALRAAILCETLKNSTDRAVILPILADKRTDAAVFSATLAYHMDICGAGQVLLLYSCDSVTPDPVAEANVISSTASSFGYDYSSLAVSWSVPSEYTSEQICDDYLTLCRSAEYEGFSLAVLDIGEKGNGELYEKLCAMTDKESIFRMRVSHSMAKTDMTEFASSVPLFDFSASYDTAGFTVGGQFTRIETDISSFGNGRVLHAYTDKDANVPGIIIKRFDSPKDLKDLFSQFDINVTGDDGAAEITIIFGTSDSRIMYSTEVESGAPSSLFCDLSEYEDAGRIEYISVAVTEGNAKGIELSRVIMGSTDPGVDIEKKLSESTDDENDPMLYATVIICAAVTAAILSLLIRLSVRDKKKRDEKKQ